MYKGLVTFLALGILTGCNPDKSLVKRSGLNAPEDLQKVDFAGEVCGGDIVSHEFRVTFDVGRGSCVDIGGFESSCSCLNTDPKVEIEGELGVLIVPVSWSTPLPSLSNKSVIEKQEVETKGIVLVDGVRRKITLRLKANIYAPISVNSNPIRIKQGSDSTAELIVRREKLSIENFSKLECVFPEGFGMIASYRDDEIIRGQVVTTGLTNGNCVMRITGLPASLSIPLIVERETKLQLSRNIVFAKQLEDEWVAIFQIEGDVANLVNASLISGKSLVSKSIDDNSFELHMKNTDFPNDVCEVAFEFLNLRGKLEKLQAKVWRDEH